MKLRSFFLALAAAVLVLLTVAGTSLAWILKQSPLPLLQGGVMAEPTAAILVSKQAPVMVSLLVNPDRLEAFGQLATLPSNRRRSHQAIKQLEQSLLANTGLNYEREIKPWIGEEVTLAVTSLDFDRDADNGIQPGYLLAVKTKDAELAREFLQLSYSQQAIAGTFDLVFEPYKGINLIYKRPQVPQSNTRLNASAVVGDFVLFANNPKVLREAINDAQVPDLNLKNAPAYQEALQTILEPHIGLVYANLPAFSAWIDNTSVPEAPDITQVLAVTLALKSQGLVAQTALLGVSGEENQAPLLAEPVDALNYVPANSLFAAAATNLTQFWAQVETGLAANSPLQQLLTQVLNRLQQPLGLNLPQDIFNWVQGEYSLALVPHPDGSGADWIFVAEKVPGAHAEEAIAHLDDLAKEQGYSVGNLPVLDTPVTAWTKLKTAAENSITRLDAQVRGVHTSRDRYEIFTSSVEAMSQALAAGLPSLVQSQKFQQAISAFPTANDGYLYLDWNQSEPLLEAKFPVLRVAELAVKPLLNNLRSLTLSAQGSENGIRRATIFFNVGVR
jgi:hypothetical protein